MEFKETINQLISKAEEKDESLIVDAISIRVREMLDRSPELLFSYMYRLDVEEKVINIALQKGNPLAPDVALAQLIWERQKKRLAFKKQFKVKPIEGWED